MTDQDTLVEKKSGETAHDEPKEEDKKPTPTTEGNKEGPPTTIDAIKTDFLQQYRNMAAITIVSL